MRYRRRRISIHQDRNRIILRVVIAIICLIAIVVGTVMLGHYLKKKAVATSTDTTPEDTTAAPVKEENPFADKTVIQAEAVSLIKEDGTAKTITELTDEIAALSYTAVSFDLRNSAGVLLYDSPSAKMMGQENTASLDMGALVSDLHEREIYVVGCFEVLAFKDGVSAEMYDAILSYDSAILCELFEYGFDEILLFDLPSEYEKIDGLVSYMEYMQKKIPEKCRLGASVPYARMIEANPIEIINKVSLFSDFIAIDISGLSDTDKTNVYENTDAYIKQIELYLSRYNMRILIPKSDSAIMQKQFDALDANAVYNYQILP